MESGERIPAPTPSSVSSPPSVSSSLSSTSLPASSSPSSAVSAASKASPISTMLRPATSDQAPFSLFPGLGPPPFGLHTVPGRAEFARLGALAVGPGQLAIATAAEWFRASHRAPTVATVTATRPGPSLLPPALFGLSPQLLAASTSAIASQPPDGAGASKHASDASDASRTTETRWPPFLPHAGVNGSVKGGSVGRAIPCTSSGTGPERPGAIHVRDRKTPPAAADGERNDKKGSLNNVNEKASRDAEPHSCSESESHSDSASGGSLQSELSSSDSDSDTDDAESDSAETPPRAARVEKQQPKDLKTKLEKDSSDGGGRTQHHFPLLPPPHLQPTLGKHQLPLQLPQLYSQMQQHASVIQAHGRPIVHATQQTQAPSMSKQPGVIQATGLASARASPGTVTARPKVVARSPAPLGALDLASDKSNNRLSPPSSVTQVEDVLRLKKEQFRQDFPAMLKRQQEELKANRKSTASISSKAFPVSTVTTHQKMALASPLTSQNVVLPLTANSKQPLSNGVISSVIQQSPLALVKTKALVASSAALPLSLSSTSSDSLPQDLTTTTRAHMAAMAAATPSTSLCADGKGKFTMGLSATQRSGRAKQPHGTDKGKHGTMAQTLVAKFRGVEALNPSSDDSDDSDDDDDDLDNEDEDDDDGEESQSDSDLETDSEGSDTEGKGAMDDTETDTEGERTPHNLSRSTSGLTPTTSAALPSSSSSVLGATGSSPLAATSLGFHGYAVVARTPSSASAALLAGLSSPGTPHNAFTMVTPESMAKRRRTADERELRVPLDHGWRRETRIQTIGDRLHGEVLYYTPCGRKLRQYPEVNKFLTRNRITDINRQSFSFSAKMRVGDFYEAREGPQGMQWCLLGDAEIAMRIKAMEGRRGRPPNPERQRRRGEHSQDSPQGAGLGLAPGLSSGTGRPRRRKGRPPNVERAEYARRAESLKLLKRLEAQAIARQAAEMKLMQKLEKQARLQAAKHARRQQAMQAAEVKRKQKEQMKMLKQQEKMQKIEQQRLEKEMRAQQILEAKRRRREEAANAKVMEAERRAQEKEMRRQHAVLLKHQEMERHRLDMVWERERRRQELLLFKALEAQKKAEERERLKQEKVQEKQLNKERKMEMRRLEMQIAMELKKPNEDMCLSEQKPMPDLPRMPGLVLPGSAFADCLMVVEFLRSFGKVLGLDVVREVPSIAALQEGLLNRGDTATSELLDLTMRLLRAVLRDPGLPHAFKDATVLGCRLRDMELTRETLSEVLRIFLEARSFSAALVSSFRTKAFLAHTPSQKASVLAFLCDELLCSRTVTSEIDKNIDHISSLRRDKWIVEGKLRTLRSKHSRRGGRRYSCVANVEEGEERRGSGAGAAATGRKRKRRSGTPSGGVAGESDDEDDEDDDDSDPEQDEEDEEDREEREERGKRRRNEHATDEEEKEMAASSNEFQKQMEKLNKQQNLYRRKLFEASHSLRALTFGQDRYRRRYWVLPHCGGLFVEAMESAEGKTHLRATKEEQERNCPPPTNSFSVVSLVSTHKPMEIVDSRPAEQQEEWKLHGGSGGGGSGNLFLQKPGSLSKFSELLEVAKMAPEMDTVSSGQASANGVNLADSSSSSSANNSPAHSRLSSPTPSTTTSQQGLKMEPMLSFSDFSTGVLFSADQLLKELSEKAKAGGRFCSSGRGASGSEETSATEGASRSSPVTTQSGQMLSMASLHSGLALNPFQLPASSTLAALQLKSGLPLLGLPLSGWPPTSLLGASLPFPSSLLGLGFSLPPSSTAQPMLLNPGLTLVESQARSGSHGLQASQGGSGSAPSAEDSAQAGTSTTPQPEVQKQNDYPTPKPIPQDLRHGWWRVTDTDTIHSVLKALHPRGIREKALQKQLQKHLDYTCQACARHRDMAKGDKGEKAECVLRREVASWSVEEQAFQADLAVLRLVEELEERVASASMQVKGWRCPERASERKNLVYHNRKHEKLERKGSSSCEAVASRAAEEVERCPIRRSDDNPLDLAAVRLAALERNIERRYLRSPLSTTIQIQLDNVGTVTVPAPAPCESTQWDGGEEEIAPGLRDWRRALLCAQNASQVALCLQQLEKAIAWEKSIMKVFCQMCRKGDNEELLLLCDGCDRGCHTYCHKPKLPAIPDGDWYCPACISKASGQSPKAGKTKSPRGRKNNSEGGSAAKKSCGRSAKSSSAALLLSLRESMQVSGGEGSSPFQSPAQSPSPSKKARNKEASLDLTPCRTIMSELESHHDAWPFLLPVNSKMVPGYRTVIRRPMDFSTMRNKLESGHYATREAFMADVRLVFKNCERFNEDESDVGRAGHGMRCFFESRWVELTGGT
ncbi:unnamed protein product [Lampetra planeri]